MDTQEFQDSIRLQKVAKAEALKLTPFRSALSLMDKKARFPGFRQRKVDYKAGQQLSSGAMVIPTDLVMHESVPMVLSDGTKLYYDIFLPPRFQDISSEVKHDQPILALIAWSPYGKQMGTTLLEDFPLRAGVPKHWLSGLQKWEGPDPAWWCQHDYAIINVDIRGAYTSEGDLIMFGHQEAEDGRVLTIYIEKIYVWAESLPRGSTTEFKAVRENPLWNSYWEDKKANTQRINVPVYAVASYTNPIHVTGTFRAWTGIPDNVAKYLRINNSQEWPDYYEDANQQDLRRFFDYYLKNIENGWSSTPKVRLSVLKLGLGDVLDTVNRAEADWPLPRTRFTRHYLNEDTSISLDSSRLTKGTVQYDANTGKAVFQYVIPSNVETTGYFMAHLVMSCAEHDEMDVFVQVERLVKNWRQGTMTIKPHGVIARSLLIYVAHDWQIGLSQVGIMFHWGPFGVIRASHALDKDEKSLPERPLYKHTRKVPLKKGELRVLDIPISPYGMYWEKGDTLQFTVAGRPINPLPVPAVRKGPETDNKGIHIIHCGGQEAESSYLLVPSV